MLIVDNRMDIDPTRVENGRRINLVRNEQDHSYSNNTGRYYKDEMVRKLIRPEEFGRSSKIMYL